VKPNRCTEGPSNGLEIVRITRHNKIAASQRSGDDGCVDYIASRGTRAGNSRGASAMLIEIFDSTAS